jgi:hypothetical protein
LHTDKWFQQHLKVDIAKELVYRPGEVRAKRRKNLIFMCQNLSPLLEVVTVRKDNISRLAAEYLVGGFMR